mgnify:CR=1 FL=1
MRRIKLSTEFDRILEKISNNENFALSRFGDGEMTIINNSPIDLEASKGEFKFDPNNANHQHFRLMLEASIKEDLKGYIKGVPCYCCANENLVNITLGNIKNKDEITLANVFVNNNIFKIKDFIAELNGRNTVITCDWKAAAIQNPNVPLNIRNCFRTKGNCIENLHILTQIAEFISKNHIENYVFLFFSGPLSNVLVHQLYKFNDKNTYIDMGSVFDPIFYGKKTRFYHDPNHINCQKICVMDLLEDKSGAI